MRINFSSAQLIKMSSLRLIAKLVGYLEIYRPGRMTPIPTTSNYGSMIPRPIPRHINAKQAWKKRGKKARK